MKIFTAYSRLEQMCEFMSRFEGHAFLFSPDEPMVLTKPKKARVCRFCGKGADQTTFDTDAHTIPVCLGNQFHISDSECDNCNKQFSDCDNQLLHYYGTIPPLTRTKGRRG